MSIRPWEKSYPPSVRWNAPLELSSVQSVLEKAAERFGARPALDFMNKRTTYAELDALANRAAAGFQKLGVGPGVHVGLFLPNTPHYVIAFFGVLKAGGVVVNYSPLDALPTLQLKVEDSETDILVSLDVASLLSPGRKTARVHPSQSADRRRIRRDDARARAGQGADESRRNAGRRQATTIAISRSAISSTTTAIIRSTRLARSPTRSPSSNIPAARPARPRAQC